MKKFLMLLAAAILTVSLAGLMTAFAFSGAVSIEGDRQVTAGKSYTYTITVSVEDAGTMIADINCSGAFKKESGDSIIEWSQTTNSSGVVYTGTFTVKVSSAAKQGAAGTITVNGSVVSYIDDNYNTDEKKFSGSFTAEVGPGGSSPEPSEWDAALESIQSMQAGGTLSVDITRSAVIPADVLAALKEKQGTLTLELAGCSCVIDGKTLTGIPGSLSAADITMTMEKEKALSSAANGQDIYQLIFAHEGQLPGRFRFSFAATENKPGDVLYLYRYYSASGVLEGIESSVVDADGLASFDIYYRSGYVVSGSVIEGTAGSLGSGSDLADMLQAQLNYEHVKNELLESKLEDINTQLAGSNEEASVQASYYQGMVSLSPALFIGVVAGALLIAVMLTMILFKAGLFAPKKAAAPRNSINVKEYRSKD